jgi:hypothetical protein
MYAGTLCVYLILNVAQAVCSCSRDSGIVCYTLFCTRTIASLLLKLNSYNHSTHCDPAQVITTSDPNTV